MLLAMLTRHTSTRAISCSGIESKFSGTRVLLTKETSEAILGLKPVTFQYKSDSERTPQFGLIAEEVA